eukprot:gnl/MRDRNA2_/MRDRNA2_76302_c0_seq1.p1 gnl/MRDRNA2_/MRDRNA2_76302_c0~~gnl/MRDRNA2_/MRDRNA2_76302_c0_seq1.p1  ORF type:complete len:850 (+),score=144.33 gnl/MRDRNA2_/MRDRNA2_76302_c0_seq1:113-2662(+)
MAQQSHQPDAERQNSGNQNEDSKPFKDSIQECEAFAHDREGYFQYEVVVKGVKGAPSTERAASMLRAETQRCQKWSIDNSFKLMKIVEELKQSAGDQPASQLQSESRMGASSVWNLGELKDRFNQSRMARRVESQYLIASEFLQLAQVNVMAGQKVMEKLEKRRPDQRAAAIAEEGMQILLAERRRLQGVVEELRFMCPAQTIEKIEVLAQSPVLAKKRQSWCSFLPDWFPAGTTLLIGIVLTCFVHTAHSSFPGDSNAPSRCGIMFSFVALLQVSQVVPMFVTGLLTPLLVLVFDVIPGKSPSQQMQGVVPIMFDQFIWLVLSILVSAAVIDKCDLGIRMVNFVNSIRPTPLASKTFLWLQMFLQIIPMTPVGPYPMSRALRPMLCDLPPDVSNAGKTIICGITLGANIGDIAMGPVNIYLLSFISKFGYQMNILHWYLLTVPTSLIICVTMFCVLLYYPGMPGSAKDDADNQYREIKTAPLNTAQYISCMLNVALLLCILNLDYVSDTCGGVAVIGFLYLTLIFFIGLLTVDDFNSLNWDVVIVVASINVMIHCADESGLAQIIFKKLIEHGDFGPEARFMSVLKLCLFTSFLSSCTGRLMFILFFLPFLMPLGTLLEAPLLVTFCLWTCVNTSFFTPYVTMELILISQAVRDNFGKKLVNSGLMMKLGALLTVFGFVATLGIAYPLGIFVLDMGRPSKPAEPDSLLIQKPFLLQKPLEAASYKEQHALPHQHLMQNAWVDIEGQHLMQSSSWQLRLGNFREPKQQVSLSQDALQRTALHVDAPDQHAGTGSTSLASSSLVQPATPKGDFWESYSKPDSMGRATSTPLQGITQRNQQHALRSQKRQP